MTRTPSFASEVDALYDIDCPSAAVCFATARLSDLSHVVLVLNSGVTLTRMSCLNRASCVGLTRDALLHPVAVTSTDGGASWTRHALPAATGYVSDLDCPSASVCHAWAYVVVPNRSRMIGQALTSPDGRRHLAAAPRSGHPGDGTGKPELSDGYHLHGRRCGTPRVRLSCGRAAADQMRPYPHWLGRRPAELWFISKPIEILGKGVEELLVRKKENRAMVRKVSTISHPGSRAQLGVFGTLS